MQQKTLQQNELLESLWDVRLRKTEEDQLDDGKFIN